MIELTIREFLKQKLQLPILMEFPEDPKVRFVVLKIEHNPRENQLESAMIVADSYEGSLLAAAKLNELVKSALDELVKLDEISSSRRGGDYPFFDTKNKRYRYQAIQNITHY